MSEYLSNEMIKQYLEKINQYNVAIRDNYNNITMLQNEIKIIKKILMEKCNHNNNIDHSNTNERTEYYCSVCLTNF